MDIKNIENVGFNKIVISLEINQNSPILVNPLYMFLFLFIVDDVTREKG